MSAQIVVRENLKFLANSSGLHRKAYAASLGIVYKTFCAYLEGRSIPRIDKLIEIADRYNLTLDVLCRNQLADQYQVTTETIITKKDTNE